MAQSVEEKIEAYRVTRARFGKMGSGKFGVVELEQMLDYLLKHLDLLQGGITKEEATKLRRQLAAAEARAARASKRADTVDLSPADRAYLAGE